MARVVSVAAVALACVAIAYAVWLHGTTNERVRTAVAEAVRAREEALIKQWKPLLRDLYKDMRLAGVKEEPETLEELFGPLISLLHSFGDEGKPGPESSPS